MFLKKQKPFLILAFLLFLFFICLSSVFALENEYPTMGGATVASSTSFPEYVVYLFNFSIGIAGIIAFGVMVFAGIKILTSPDQPETIKDARTKMIGALLGIIILLASYLILVTINPNLIFPNLKPIPPTSGVYITDSVGKDHYVPDSSNDLGYTGTAVKFISPPEELTSIYYAGNTEVPNMGSGSVGSFSGKSIYFLWNRPGIDLYPDYNYLGQPIHIDSNVKSFATINFDKKAKSFKFRDLPGSSHGVILFTQSDYRGMCGFNSITDVPDIEKGGGPNYIHPIGAPDLLKEGGLSSLLLFNFSTITPGNIIVYKKANCPDGGLQYQINVGGGLNYFEKLSIRKYPDGTPLKDNIISFKINGNYAVLLSEEEEFLGPCQTFFKPGADNCYPSLESSYLWKPGLWSPDYVAVGSLIIIPM